MKKTNTFIIAGPSNLPFAQNLSKKTGITLAKMTSGRFSNGEAKVRIEEDIFGKTFYVTQSLSIPVDENIMELCLIVDALKRGGAEKISAIVPWFGYGPQDKVFMPGEALSSKVVIDFLQTVGINSLMTLDLHSDNIIGFFEVPVVHVTIIPLFAQYIRKNYGQRVLVVSPDFGGAKRARRFAKDIGQKGFIGIVDKERSLTSGKVKLRGINLDVKNKTVVMLDDFVSTGSTMLEVVKLLSSAGAKKIISCITHPLLSGDAAEKISHSPVDELVVSDSVIIDDKKKGYLKGKLHIISSASLFAPFLKI
ncbi:ribose-phosphate pyrophosphokinase [Candidatus Gottesmanbacteria bacterium]|nr:ribose-phosphate pyrophosphokinase [Candidatus Gottesmanbacteria bacterium]